MLELVRVETLTLLDSCSLTGFYRIIILMSRCSVIGKVLFLVLR